MGKRNRQKRSKNNSEGEAPVKPGIHEIVEVFTIVKSILEKASKPLKNVKEEWENYLELHQLVDSIRQKQSKYVLQRAARSDCVTAFMTWMTENDVDTSAVAIHEFKEGLGLQAQKQIPVNELFVKIPRKVMMSVETAAASPLGSLMKSDRLMQAMSNVALALHVVCEAHNPDSFFKPYLDILPESYSTPLYFSPQDVELLRGSPVFPDILNQYRSIARQYAYFFKLFQENTEVKLPMDYFTYDDYRWAVSTVMTRQNQIPGSTRAQMLALIPLWDMCNHTEGQFTTDYSTETACGECYALRQFDEGEQVYIYYGPRSNADFLLNNGFVYPANPSDRLEIRIGLSKTEPLYSKRCDLLSKLSLLPSGRFQLHRGEDPVDSELLAYLRVFHMTQEELDERLAGAGKSRERVGVLRDFGEIVSEENERKSWRFLSARCQLLLKAYAHTLMEDRALLQGDTLTDTQRMLVQQRYMEKNMLQGGVEFIERYEQELEISIQEQKVEALKLAAQEQRRAQQSRDAPAQAESDDDIDIDSITALPQK